MESQEANNIQIMTIQTLGRVTECIARLSHTVRSLSLMESLLQIPSACGDDSAQIQHLFEGIDHSVKHMELLTLSVEQKFKRVGNIIHGFSKTQPRDCKSDKISEDGSCLATYSIDVPSHEDTLKV